MPDLKLRIYDRCHIDIIGYYLLRGCGCYFASIQSLDGCCGAHEICEKESLLAAVSKNIEYYDDEELDRFKGYSSNSYSSGEVQEFADVLYTLRSEEVAGWVRSLQLREIELPDQLKDEIVMIVGERRRS